MPTLPNSTPFKFFDTQNIPPNSDLLRAQQKLKGLTDKCMDNLRIVTQTLIKLHQQKAPLQEINDEIEKRDILITALADTPEEQQALRDQFPYKPS